MEEQLPNNNNEARSELWNLTIRDLFYKYVRFLPLFILSVAVALFGAYGYLRYTTPIFSTTGTIILKGDQQKSGGSNEKFDALFGGGKGINLQTEIEVLKSKGLMTKVVEKLNLQYNYFVIGKIKTINIYKTGPFLIESIALTDSMQPFTLKINFENDKQFRVNKDKTLIPFNAYFKNQYGTFRLVRNPFVGVSKDYEVEYQPTITAASMYASGIIVTPKVGGSAILNISTEGANPVQCADIINQLMAEYSDFTKELKNITANQMIQFIDTRMESLGKELDSALNNLLAYTEKHKIFDLDVQKSETYGKISEADKLINEQLFLINTADFIETYLNERKNDFKKVSVPSALNIGDPALAVLLSSYNQFQIERAGLLNSNVPANHPIVLEVNGKIENTKLRIFESLSYLKKSLYKDIGTYKQNSGKAMEQLQELPYITKEYVELKRQADNKQLLFNILQEKKEETALTRAANIANVQNIEKAYIPNTPIKPNRRSIQMMAILVGLMLPALVIFGMEMLNDKVATRFDVEKITNAPILGEIGHSFSDNVLIVNKTSRSMVAEQFRIIRSNLQYIIGKADRFTLLVTSSYGGEGKSFLSTNVGAVLGLAGKKTIILEFDIRKPKVLSGLKMQKSKGLTNYLIGKADLPDLIQQVPDTENLYVLACGPIPPNPSELLLDDKVEELFSWLKKEFEVIIVDTAPVGMVSDAQTLSKFCDSTLYMVRQGHTFKKQITLIDEFYVQKKLPKVAIVINDVKQKLGYGYYGHGRYGYGYGYGYGSYYEEETPPLNFFERILSKLNPVSWFRKK